MTNITQCVWNFLNKNPAIKRNLSDDIINIRALANHILKEENLTATTHSAISAIRRFKKEQLKKRKKNPLADILRNSKISTKSRLFCITMSRDLSFLSETMPKILKMIDVHKGELIRMAEGRVAMKIIVDNAKKDDMLSVIPRDKIYSTEENIGEINIRLDDRKGDVPGVMATVLNEIAAHEINIIEMIGSLPEIILIIKEKDISAAHEVLLRLFYGDISSM